MSPSACTLVAREKSGGTLSPGYVFPGRFCEASSWEDFSTHFALFFVTIFLIMNISLVLSSRRSWWHGEYFAKSLRPFTIGLLSNRFYLGISAVGALLVLTAHVLRIEGEDPFGNIGETWNQIEFYVCIPHLLEALLVWVFSTASSSGALSSIPVSRLAVDSAILSSLFYRELGGSQLSHMSFSYLGGARFALLWRMYQRSLPPHKQGVKLQVLDSCIILIMFVFSVAMLLQQVETLSGTPWPFNLTSSLTMNPPQRWTLSASTYFILSIATTVGYGDLWPQSLLAQIAAAFITLIGIYMLLRNSLRTLEAIKLGMGGSGSYERRTRNKVVLVCGSPSFQVLRDFISELYHEDHEQEAEELNLVLMLPGAMMPTMQHVKKWLRQPSNVRIHNRVLVLQGSVLKRRDLTRAGFKDAAMAWVLPNLYAADPDHEDVENAMRALALRQFTPYARVIALTMKAESCHLFHSVGVGRGDLLSADEFKLGLFGKSCQVQGFISVASILFKNMSVPRNLERDAVDQPWIRDYAIGFSNEVYEVDLSKAYFGAPFGAIAIDALERSDGKAYLIGFVEEAIYPGDKTVTKLFPGLKVHVAVGEDRRHRGIFVASCREDIVQMPNDEYFAWTFDTKIDSEAAWSRKGLNANGDAPALPNAVPTQLAALGRQGYIKEDRELRADKQDELALLMTGAAALRTAKSLSSKARLPATDAEALVGGIPRGKDGKPVQVSGAAAGGDGDVAGKLLDQHKEAEREAEKEAEQLMIEAEVRQQTRVADIFSRAMGLLEEETDINWQEEHGTKDFRKQQEDIQLWGSQQPPPARLFGNPQEPPSGLLIKGGHVLVLALDGSDRSGGSSGSTSGASSEAVRAPGKRLELAHFMRSLRSGVLQHRVPQVVVLANEVPSDWPQVAKDGGVYFILGPPISGIGLRRAGLQQASAVVIYQRCASVTKDPSTVDSEAVFACRLVESLVNTAGRDIPVYCDVMLERNAFYIPHVERLLKGDHYFPVLPTKKKIGDEDEEEQDDMPLTVVCEDRTLPFYLQKRFANGQLFVSGVITATAANMMYNPCLAAIFQEMLRAGYAVVPVPDEWIGTTFGSLFIFLMRKRNLLAVALLRKLAFDADYEDDIEEEAEEKADKDGKKDDVDEKAAPKGPAERWSPQDAASARCVITMPPGERRVADHDGILCMLPLEGRADIFGMGMGVRPPGA